MFLLSPEVRLMVRESCRSFLVWLVAATVVGSSAVEGRGKEISASNGKMPVFLNPDIIF